MNPKNILAENCQKIHKNNNTLPIYNPKRIGGSDHSPIWICEVKMYNGKTYIGDKCGTKKEAEFSAAQKALDSKLYQTNPSIKLYTEKEYNFITDNAYVANLTSLSETKDWSASAVIREDWSNNEAQPEFANSHDLTGELCSPSNNFTKDISLPNNTYILDKKSKKIGNKKIDDRKVLHFSESKSNDSSEENVEEYFYKNFPAEKNPTHEVRKNPVKFPHKLSSRKEKLNTENLCQNNSFIEDNQYKMTQIFVDVENKPKIALTILKLNRKIASNIKIIFVFSDSFPAKDKYINEITNISQQNNNISYILVKGNAGFLDNSSDMAITILASRVNDDSEVIIITGDKFATLLNLVGNTIDDKKRFHHISNEADVMNLLMNSQKNHQENLILKCGPFPTTNKNNKY